MILKGRTAFIYAHPDDETFMSGCLIRQLANEGNKPILLLATRGDAGFKNGDYSRMTRKELGKLREEEMNKAANLLGLDVVEQLGYPDGRLNETSVEQLSAQIVQFANDYSAEALFTFPPDGDNGHPDHIMISLAVTTAFQSGLCKTARVLYYSLSSTMIAQGRTPDLVVDVSTDWLVKAAALREHDSQKYAIEQYFGTLDVFQENRRYEAFVIGGGL